MINEIEGLERVRFMTSHPKDLTVDVIMAIKNVINYVNKSIYQYKVDQIAY